MEAIRTAIRVSLITSTWLMWWAGREDEKKLDEKVEQNKIQREIIEKRPEDWLKLSEY